MEKINQTEIQEKIDKSQKLTLEKLKLILSFQRQAELKYLLALPSKILILIFNQGDIVQVGILAQKIIMVYSSEQDIKHPLVINDHVIGFINANTQQFELYDSQLNQVINNLQIQIPTLQCLPLAERTPVQLENFYSDGIKIVYLNVSYVLVSLEVSASKKQYILTAVFLDSKQIITQHVVEIDSVQKFQYMKKANETDTVILYHSMQVEQILELYIWKIDIINKSNAFKKIIIQDNIVNELQIFCVQPITKLSFLLWFNNLQQKAPCMAKIDMENQDQDVLYKGLTPVPVKIDLAKQWEVIEIIGHDTANNLIIWERFDQLCNYLDIYNFKSMKLEYTEQLRYDQDQKFIECNKVISSDNKYIVTYDDTNQDEFQYSEKNERDLPILLRNIKISSQQ